MATDFNPDREGHVAHKWLVQNAYTDRKESIRVDGKDLKLNREGRLLIKDEAVANAIRTEYGRELTVTRMRYPTAHDAGHNYFFGGVGMPWHKYDEFGRRIRDEEKQEAGTESTQDAQEEKEGQEGTGTPGVHEPVKVDHAS